MTDITEGIVIGTVSAVIGGLVVYVISRLKPTISIWRNRREEIKRLRDIIENFRDLIYTAKDFDFKGKKYTVEKLRRARFDDMASQLQNALDKGSPNLSYDEKQEIRDAIHVYINIYPDVLPNIGAYNEIFSKLEELKWLKLSARTD